MKHIVRKYYLDYRKEEQWLNEMSAKGFVLSDYSWCRYVFAEAEPGEYIYRTELLEKAPTHPESMAYIRFLEENRVECVATYMRWIYLRKKSSEGPFDIYSDIDSKIKHYRRVSTLIDTLMYMDFGAAFLNLTAVHVLSFSGETEFPIVNAVCAGILIVIGIILVRLGRPIRKMIRRLKQEKTIRE